MISHVPGASFLLATMAKSGLTGVALIGVLHARERGCQAGDERGLIVVERVPVRVT